MKVLVALDASPQCSEIVEEIAARPWPPETSFALVHVLDPFPYAKVPLSLARAKEDAKNLLQMLGKRLCANGWDTESSVVLGRARQEIAKIADRLGADWVVIGSHGKSAMTRLFLGSTARGVLRHATCSVEIVRSSSVREGPIQSSGRRILVATDGSEYSAAALESVARRPWPDGSKFYVISVPEPFLVLGRFPYFEVAEMERMNSDALKDAKRFAESGAEILRKAGWEVEIETPFANRSCGWEIVEEAKHWGAEMIVLGSHGRRGFERLTLGSVSEHVALHAHCSVEVIREPLQTKSKGQKKQKKGVKP